MTAAVVLDGVSFRHGAWRDLDDLIARELASPEEVKILSQGGLRCYSVIDRPVREYYRDCVAESMEGAGIKPAAIDSVIFFSSSFSSYDNHADLIQLARELGMRNALPMGLFGAQCSNFSYALLVAQSLIDARGMRSVLLLGSDALDETRASRLLPGTAAVSSDTVFSCLVSTELANGFLVEHVEHAVEPELSALDPQNDLLDYMFRFSRTLKTLCLRTYASTGRQPSEFSHLVLANLSTSVLKNYAAVAGFPFERVPTPNKERFGHCFAYDQLISLSTLVERGELATGDAALLLAIGATYLFSSTTLRRL